MMDETRRKLILFEAQLSGQSLSARLIGAAPLFFLAVGLMTGIIAQAVFSRRVDAPDTLFRAWHILLGTCGTVVTVYAIRTRRDPKPCVLAIGAAMCFLCLGAIRMSAFERPAPNDIRHLVGDERALATIEGQIVTSPRLQTRDWYFARLAFSEPASSFHLAIRRVKTEAGWRDADGTVRVQVNEPTPNLHLGDVVRLHCWLHRFEPPTNPGQFDLAAHLKRRNIHLGAAVPLRSAVTVLDSTAPSLFSRTRNKLSELATLALLGDQPDGDASDGLPEALLLGHRENIDRPTYEAFRRTGLLHMISLSGLHLGILVGLLWRFCRTIGLLKPARALVCIVATATFLMVVPPRAPTVRAAVIVWAFCAAILLRRHAHPLNALCLATIILLLVRPTQLSEVGWQLSFACVAGILALTDHVEDIVRDRVLRRFARKRQSHAPSKVLLRRVGAEAARLFFVGVAAWIGGAGIILFHFYVITPLTCLWTVLVFPLVALILTLGFLKILLFFFLPTVSYLLGYLAGLGADLLTGTVKILAKPDINCILIGHVTLWAVILYYALVLYARFAPLRRPILKRTLCLTMILLLVGYIGILKWQRTYRHDLSMTCLDVGHGQAILVQFPDAKNVLFDAGSMYHSDVGSRIVVPFLDYIGVSRLHAITISHNDIDHINGIPEIVDRRHVDHIYTNEASAAQAEPGSPLALLACYLEAKGRVPECVPASLCFGPACVDVLWPGQAFAGRDDLSDNDRSLLTQIHHADVSIVLCSDIEQFAQQHIMALYPDLTAQIVVVPHHGSSATRHAAFLPRLQPEIAIVSCGRRQRHPRQPPTGAFAPRYFLTSENGAISFCVQEEGVVKVTPYVPGSNGE